MLLHLISSENFNSINVLLIPERKDKMVITAHRKPTKSKELRTYEALFPRKRFSALEKNHYDNLLKGHTGELKFAGLLQEHPSENRIAMFDLLFESNQTEFQIDSLVMTSQTIYLLEIKYFTGDFFVENDKWFVVNSCKEIRNPLLQLKRTEFLFQQLLQKLKLHLTVKSYIAFNNENFTLYQAPIDLPLVFPTQLNRFIHMLNSNSRDITHHQTKLAERLASMHLTESKNSRLPEYEYAELKKGIICRHCKTLFKTELNNKLKCKKCGIVENVEAAVMRNVREFNFLFPKRKITMSIITEWCAELISKNRIRRILLKNMKLIHNARYSHYIFNDPVENNKD